MKVIVSRRIDGTLMITEAAPVNAQVKGTEVRNAYHVIGEPFGVLHLCSPGLLRFFRENDPSAELPPRLYMVECEMIIFPTGEPVPIPLAEDAPPAAGG